MTSEERRTLMVIEHGLCSEDPELVAQFARFGSGGAGPSVSTRRDRHPAGWALAAVLWAAAAACLVVGAVLDVQAAVLAGMLIVPLALWATLSQPVDRFDRRAADGAVSRRRPIGRR